MRRRLKDHASVEDVVQETFIGFSNSIVNYDDRRDLQTWLFTIANNLALNALRDRKRRPVLPLEVHESGPLGPRPTEMATASRDAPPTHNLQQEELARVIRGALEELNERQRVAIVLNKFEDMNYADIADDPKEALRIAKVYLLKWHAEGQLPYESLTRVQPHADALVRECEAWLGEHFRESSAVGRVATRSRVPSRTLKRRFKDATGLTLIDYVQNLRIEEAKRLLEQGDRSADDISAEVGYEDASFFRRLFKRKTGLSPKGYRRLFSPALLEPGSASGLHRPRGRRDQSERSGDR